MGPSNRNGAPSFTRPGLDPETAGFYRRAMLLLKEAGIPFLVGGAYAFACYTNITRHTKDFDLFLRQAHLDAARAALDEGGYETDVTFPHWLAKVFWRDASIDLIYHSGNGVSVVDDAWFERAADGEVLGVPVRLCPPEEIIWTKAFIMERERYDGADVVHLLHGHAGEIDWDHLLALFDGHWHVLLCHLILFGFIYPGERDRIPQAVMRGLIERLQEELRRPPQEQEQGICRGTLLSRAQYLVDIECWGYQDARLHPHGSMTAEEINHWTAAIEPRDRPNGE